VWMTPKPQSQLGKLLCRTSGNQLVRINTHSLAREPRARTHNVRATRAAGTFSRVIFR
jgi:hypothetical protein